MRIDPEECRRRADTYARLIPAAASAELRKRLSTLATTWRNLAAQTEDYEALLCKLQMEKPPTGLSADARNDWADVKHGH
jgi:hypothetical protein